MMLDKMRQALQWNAQVYERVRQVLRAGMTERELLAVVEDTYFRCAGRRIPYSYDLVSGPRSGAIEGLATDRVLQTGDCVLLDIQAENDGVWCDTTRTFFLGTPSPYWTKAYATVLAAIRAGEAILRPGISAEEVYTQVSARMEQNGFPALSHHAGHALGKAKLEAPQFLRGNKQTLCAGMTVTLEPGIYLADENGIRVENNYLVTKDGCQALFEYPEDLPYFIITEKG